MGDLPPMPVCGLWSVVCGLWSVVCGLWSVVCGLWSVVCGLWSVVCGLWSVVCGDCSYGSSLGRWDRSMPVVLVESGLHARHTVFVSAH
ncbi:hypothetical protein E3T34_14515 [Cryobacterium sp. TMT1-62]|nr:hypothetical protein E3T34_14515 [Cryobacterium sp. TMT1-62]